MIEFTVNTANDKYEAARLSDFTYFSPYKFKDLHRVASEFNTRNNLKNLSSEKYMADPSAGLLMFKNVRFLCRGRTDYDIIKVPEDLHNVVTGSLRYLKIFLSKVVTRENDHIIEMLEDILHKEDAITIDLVQRRDRCGVYYNVLSDGTHYRLYSTSKRKLIHEIKTGIRKFDTTEETNKVVLW